MRRLSLLAMLLPALAVQACSGGGGQGSSPTPSITVPPVVTQSYTFPSGDAHATTGTAWDIVGIKTTLTGSGNDRLGNAYDHLQVDVSFSQDVSNALPVPGSTTASDGSQLGVSVVLDTDNDPSTGSIGVCSSARPNARPFDYLTDPGVYQARLSDGNYSIAGNNGVIYSGPPNPDAEAITSASGHVVSFIFNLNTLGVFAGSKVPRIGIGATAFNTKAPATDCVPTGSNGIDEVYTTSL